MIEFLIARALMQAIQGHAVQPWIVEYLISQNAFFVWLRWIP